MKTVNDYTKYGVGTVLVYDDTSGYVDVIGQGTTKVFEMLEHPRHKGIINGFRDRPWCGPTSALRIRSGGAIVFCQRVPMAGAAVGGE